MMWKFRKAISVYHVGALKKHLTETEIFLVKNMNGPMAHVPFICMQKSRFLWVIRNFDGPF